MSILGIDFGSHTASLALWTEEKNTLEVLADDMGSRTIPCIVAFRGEEIIVGQAALSQQHKNANNTFDDVRALIMDPEVTTVSVPLLEKEITVQELTSHFFRNIHNQIKQQVGKVVRECVISVPQELDETVKSRMLEAAQAGGVRIKAFLQDTTTTLMAYNLDDPGLPPARTVVIDVGWSTTCVSLYDVSGGLMVPMYTSSTTDVSGSVFVKLMSEHCAKDFMKKNKFPCTDNKRAMMRLRRECENAMKALSTGQEATIDIDSLCEGADFSMRLSKARFEDLLSIPFIHLKKSVSTALETAGWDVAVVDKVILAGGPSAMPKIVTIMKTIFPSATFPKARFEPSETQCVGAACHGKFLMLQGLIDKVPTASPTASCLTFPLLLGSSVKDTTPVQVLSLNTVLPAKIEIPASLSADTTPAGTGFLQLFAGAESAPTDPARLLGECVFTLEQQAGGEADGDASAVVITLGVSEEGAILMEVKQTVTGVVVGSLAIPAAN